MNSFVVEKSVQEETEIGSHTSKDVSCQSLEKSEKVYVLCTNKKIKL